jgi:FkbM family methyltransferase
MFLYIKKFVARCLALFNIRLLTLHSHASPKTDSVLLNCFTRNAPLIIFDVGAHWGESAKHYKQLFKNSNIYSFEPFSEAYNELSKLKMPNFHPLNFGLSDENKNETFNINIGTATNSLLDLDENARKLWGDREILTPKSKVNCEFRTLDSFCLENDIEFIDFLKIDVQGAEYRVLKGANGMLTKKAIKAIQVEVFFGDSYKGQKPIEYYIPLIQSYGYKLKMLCDFQIINNDLLQADLFFVLD